MTKETYEVSRDEAQTLNVEELMRHNSELKSRLRRAKKQIGEQREDLARLRDGKRELRLELADANSEIGRLVTALAHEADSAEDKD